MNDGSSFRMLAVLTGLLCGIPLLAQTQPQPQPSGTSAERPARGRAGGAGRGEVRMPTPAFRTDVPARDLEVILGRPTSNSVTLSMLAFRPCEGRLAFGREPGTLTQQTPRQILTAGEPVELELSGLTPNTRYYYQLTARSPDNGSFETNLTGSFQTARPPGSAFTFTVQADPHLDFGTDPVVYQKSLEQVLASHPDFHVDLGDTFMTDKYVRHTEAAAQYLAQRYYFGLIGSRVPLFLVLGNHDGEQPSRGGSGPDSVSVWSNTMRKRYFPNPTPNGFYTGNTQPHPHAGSLENYYAWEWGDALFVALDPFWYSSREPRGTDSNWGWTLGVDQYRWLQRTLERSHATFTFVFIHHLVGGRPPDNRGGAEVSPYFEWGGRDWNGTNSFSVRRPGWPLPIHDLLVKRGPCIVFHGHDHLYAYQPRDGIIYQAVPQPGHSRADNTRSAAEYGYEQGVIQGSSGILRVSVAPEQTRVEYVRAYPDSLEDRPRRTGVVTHHYEVDRHDQLEEPEKGDWEGNGNAAPPAK